MNERLDSDSTNPSIQSEIVYQGVCSQPADEYTQWNNSNKLHKMLQYNRGKNFNKCTTPDTNNHSLFVAKKGGRVFAT